MAAYKKLKNGWRVQICCEGIRQAKSFPTKGECKGWADNLEHKIRHGKFKYSSKELLDDVLDRYLKDVVPTHKGFRRETTFINGFKRHRIALTPIADITPTHMAEWRDERLKSVVGSSVNRELNILSAVFSKARKDWGLVESNPVAEIYRPANSPPRKRRVSEAETAAIVAELKTESERTVAIMFLLAKQTAMRQGEICAIREDFIKGGGEYVHLPGHVTKNGEERDVPLTPEAKRLVYELVERKPLVPGTVSRLFREARQRAKIQNLRFHDSRHEAATFLATKLDVMQLAKMGGWKSVGILLNTYYNPSPGEIASKLR